MGVCAWASNGGAGGGARGDTRDPSTPPAGPMETGATLTQRPRPRVPESLRGVAGAAGRGSSGWY